GRNELAVADGDALDPGHRQRFHLAYIQADFGSRACGWLRGAGDAGNLQPAQQGREEDQKSGGLHKSFSSEQVHCYLAEAGAGAFTPGTEGYGKLPTPGTVI